MSPMIEAQNLRLELSGRDVFTIESFVLQRGEVLALVGPNGAGKSSLLLTLALLQRPTEGRITFDGISAEGSKLLQLRRRMAVVFQDALLLDATVRANVGIPLRIRGFSRKEVATRTEKWLRRFGVEHLARRPARNLSGGEAQRTSLARAFALEPEVLFLDEPFASLDYPTRKALVRDLGPILRDMNMTTLFVTHDYTEIPRIARNVAVLFEGRMIKSGSVGEVFGDELMDRRVHVPWEIP